MPTVSVNIPNTTFVSSAQPDNNLSFYPLMYTGTDPGFHNCISFLQITLPALPVTAVDSALLELAVIVKTGAAASTVVVNGVTQPFDINTVTYNTSPTFTATSSQINIEASDLYQTVQIDVTSLVNGWLSGAYDNDGIALTNADGTTLVEFATDNIVYEPYFPKLTLTYSEGSQSSALCFSFAQLAHVIEQLITLYPENVFTVFTTGLTASTVTGTPYALYSSPEGTYGGLFILLDSGQQQAIPLYSIGAIYTGDGTVYDPSITYLPTPQFPPGCDTNLITAIHDYLPVLTDVDMYMGSNIHATGTVYKDEYGLLVLSDAEGNTPVFIPVLNITVILPTPAVSGLEKSERPVVTIEKKLD